MEISKINSTNSINDRNNLSFQKRIKIPKVRSSKVTESTLKLVSSVAAATGMAQLMLNKSDNDYTIILAKNIKRANLSKEDEKSIVDALDVAPTIVDIALSTKNKNQETRFVSKTNIQTIVESYEVNPELTEQLTIALDTDGDFRYSPKEIKQIIEANELSPELLEPAMDNPQFVTELINKTTEENTPLYGIKDIIFYEGLYKENPEFTQEVIKQQRSNHQPRFNGVEADFLQKHIEDEFAQFLFNESEEKPSKYQYKFRLSGHDIWEIYTTCETEKDRNFAKKLIAEKFPEYDGTQKKLTSKDIIKILKQNNVGICDMYREHSDNKKLIKILQLKNEDIPIDELKEIIRMKRPYGSRLFSIEDLKTISPNNYPEAIVSLAEKDFTDEEEIKLCCHAKINPKLTYNVMNTIGFAASIGRYPISTEDALEILDKGKENPELMIAVFNHILEEDLIYYRSGESTSDLRKLFSRLKPQLRKQLTTRSYLESTKNAVINLFDNLKERPETQKYFPN